MFKVNNTVIEVVLVSLVSTLDLSHTFFCVSIVDFEQENDN